MSTNTPPPPPPPPPPPTPIIISNNNNNNNIPITNRLFLSHINYNNNNNNNEEEEINTETETKIKEGLKELFSEYGSVQEIFLSDNDCQKFDIEDKRYLPSFGFIAMETSKQAEIAIRELTKTTPAATAVSAATASTTSATTSSSTATTSSTTTSSTTSATSSTTEQQQQRKRKLLQLRQLFRDVQPARIYKSKNNTNNKKEKKRAILLKEYNEISSYIINNNTNINDNNNNNNNTGNDSNNNNTNNNATANIICQTHTSHVERLKEYLLTKDGVQLIGCYSPQKCTSLILLRVTGNNCITGNCIDIDLDLDIDYLEEFSQQLWDTWYIAPNLNRVTILNDNNNVNVNNVNNDNNENSNNDNNDNNTNDNNNVNNNNKLIEGNIRNDVVPAIFRSLLLLLLESSSSSSSSLSESKDDTNDDIDTNDDNTNDDNTNDVVTRTVSLRVYVFPPKLQTSLLEGLDEYNNNNNNNNNNIDNNNNNNNNTSNNNNKNLKLKIVFTPTNPTHTISVIQLHKGIDVVVHNKQTKITNVNNKGLFVIGRLEKTATNTTTNKTNTNTNTTTTTTANNNNNSHPPINIKNVTTTTTTAAGGDTDTDTDTSPTSSSSSSSSSISRAYWKLQEAWERYKYESPNLTTTTTTATKKLDCDGNESTKLLWALDCGSAPGGWTKFLFRPGVVDRVYSIDPGKLSIDVLPGLDAGNGTNGTNGTNGASNMIVRYMDTTIQKAIPQLQIECCSAESSLSNNNSSSSSSRYLDIWVSDMCCKDMSSQIDYFLLARNAGIIGKGTFFVLTIKCIVGYSTKAFNEQSNEQVLRLTTATAAATTESTATESSTNESSNGGLPIANNVHNIHLFSNRNSERTIIGYLN